MRRFKIQDSRFGESEWKDKRCGILGGYVVELNSVEVITMPMRNSD